MVRRILIDVAVNRDRHPFELTGQTRKALHEREHQLADAGRIDGDLIDAAGMLRQTAWEVDGRHASLSIHDS